MESDDILFVAQDMLDLLEFLATEGSDLTRFAVSHTCARVGKLEGLFMFTKAASGRDIRTAKRIIHTVGMKSYKLLIQLGEVTRNKSPCSHSTAN